MINYRVNRHTRRIGTGIFRTIFDNFTTESRTRNNTARFQISQQCCKPDGMKLLGLKGTLLSTLQRQIYAPNHLHLQHRYHSSNPQEELPSLTDLPIIRRASFITSFKCFFLSTCNVALQLDEKFTPHTYLKTAEKVLEVVSQKLSECDYESLEEMVTADVFYQIKKNLPRFTENQRSQLIIRSECHASSMVDLQITESETANEKYLQITTVHHVMDGLPIKDVMSLFDFQKSSHFKEELEKLKGKNVRGLVANLRLLRVFNVETGTAGDWIINGLNYTTRNLQL